MMRIVLPAFSINAAMARTAAHAAQTRHSDTGSAHADMPTIRNYIAWMPIKTDMAGALLDDAIVAVEAGRPGASLRVLECKACAGETANEVLDLAMRICGGAAFRKEVGVEGYFRDARAAGIMAPATDVLYDFIGKAVCGLPLF
jgi:alkylation response protein AidB-like acyl-CoA dehydrogenase